MPPLSAQEVWPTEHDPWTVLWGWVIGSMLYFSLTVWYRGTTTKDWGDISTMSSGMLDKLSGMRCFLWRNSRPTLSILLPDQDQSSQTDCTHSPWAVSALAFWAKVLKALTNQLSSSFFHQAIGAINHDWMWSSALLFKLTFVIGTVCVCACPCALVWASISVQFTSVISSQSLTSTLTLLVKEVGVGSISYVCSSSIEAGLLWTIYLFHAAVTWLQYFIYLFM